MQKIQEKLSSQKYFIIKSAQHRFTKINNIEYAKAKLLYVRS